MQDKSEVGQDLHEYIKKFAEGENMGRFQCTLCGKISRFKQRAVMHVESVHFPGSYEYECDQCSEKFGDRVELERHIVNDHKRSQSECVLRRIT